MRRIYLYGLLAAWSAGLYAGIMYYWPHRSSPMHFFTSATCDPLLPHCSNTLETGEHISLLLNLTVLPTVIPISAQVKLDNFPSAKHVFIRFINFDGEALERDLPLLMSKDGFYYGKTTLPSFPKAFIPWQANIFVEAHNKTWIAPFTLNIKNIMDPVIRNMDYH